MEYIPIYRFLQEQESCHLPVSGSAHVALTPANIWNKKVLADYISSSELYFFHDIELKQLIKP